VRSGVRSTEPQPPIRNPQSPIRNLEAWQLDPSARDFTALIERVEVARVEEKGTSYVLTYQSDRAESEPGLLKATLVLSKADLHAVEQTLLVRVAEDNPPSTIRHSQFREYRFMETSFERRPTSAVAPAVFELEPELLGGMKDEGGRMKVELTPVHPSSLIPHPSAVATAELEVEALRLLNQIGADLDDQASVTRTMDGSLRISGIVETDERKAEILRVLAPIANHRAVKIEVETVAEAVSRQARQPSSPGALVVQQVEVQQARIAVYTELRQHFAPREAQVDREISRFATRMLNRSRQALSHAGALKQLAGRFSQEDLRTLTPEGRAKWLAVVSTHARAVEQESARLRLELQPIFFPAAPSDEAPDASSITDEASLLRAVERLFELVSANDRVIRSAFTISTESAANSALKTSQFWLSLRGAEKLAARIVGSRQ
jgi:hypothetical protein